MTSSMMKPVLLLLLATAVCAGPSHKDPEIGMTATQMIQYWGYPAEIISATTSDGYVLELHRIPYGKNGPGTACRPVVFLQHGLEGDSTNWILNRPDNSAGFMFADAGFDVWLGNFRGNTYSRAHTTLDPAKSEFWKFSWDEMSQFDLPTMIDKVLAVTNTTSLYYVGHSQGTLTMFSKLSAVPEFASKLKQFYALAPVGTVKHIEGMGKFLADFILPEFKLWYQIFGSGEFLPNNWFMKLLADAICGIHIGDDLCDNILFMLGGPETQQFNKTRSEVYFSHFPAGTSTQNMMHWAQMVKEGTVARLDYGSAADNQKHYGSSKPPSYDFATIKTDMILYWSTDDWLANTQDIHDYLYTTLNPNYVKKIVQLSKYNHFDFIMGSDAHFDVYTPIISQIRASGGFLC